ncbi:MAG: hypothetical protein HY319_19545 [Armatimonadetes bacterium]|nr:hypothetical protein [Armatimonadota bacterium]
MRRQLIRLCASEALWVVGLARGGTTRRRRRLLAHLRKLLEKDREE